MPDIRTFGQFEFEPPVPVRECYPEPLTLGGVVAHALIQAGNIMPELQKVLFLECRRDIDREISDTPEDALRIVQTALNGQYTVKWVG